MTPKEKAEELFDKFYLTKDERGLCRMNEYMAKQCALISVNNELESIMLLSLLCNFDNPMKPRFEQKITELKEVKTEIEKL